MCDFIVIALQMEWFNFNIDKFETKEFERGTICKISAVNFVDDCANEL